MAPLSLFRGQGGITNSTAATVAVDPLPLEPPGPPPPNELRRSLSGGGEPVPSPSRLNPARLLRRKGSRSIREPRDRGERDEGWFGALRGQGHGQISHSASGSFDRMSAGRLSGSSAHSDAPQLVPSPSIRGLAHIASVSISTSPRMSHSRQGSAGSISAVPSASANASNFGSVRSMRSMRSIHSDGVSTLTHDDTEIIIGPSPDHPLIKGEPSVMYHHPFLLPASGPSGSYPTPLSPPRRPPRSPIPPPPPLRTGPIHYGESRPSTPSSGSAYSDKGDSGQSAAPTVRPDTARTDPAEATVWRSDTAAWLARRPSGRRHAPLASVVDGRPRAESLSSHVSPSVSGTSASGESVDEPLTPTVSPRIGGLPITPTFPQQHRAPITAVASPSPAPLSQPPAAPRTPDRSGYVVSVQCLPSADDDEVRWQVVLRRSLTALDADGIVGAPAPGGPVLLAPGTSGAQNVHAPPFASSVNLSLALDTNAPSGKLQFITLPNATPNRVRPRSVSQSATPASPRSYRAAQAQSPNSQPSIPAHSPNSQPIIPRDSVFGPSAVFGSSAVFGHSVLGPPAALSPPTQRPQTPPPALAPPTQRPQTPPPADARAPQEPLSPRSPAYKRQGAVWAASGGFSPLGGDDVFTASPHMPSPRAARERAKQ
ncbi:hypothetical protein CcaverHIS002_0605960 [Cutaneotrichosporon cavernicola]|uniref:Uncharacterized protein n=1 Tax=Cutaneotrichosporon cavernicola TaxID=279322 RepID=A0AA48QY83_9TREE|nr:uncharacterized protein CcaverHIS019_0605420 [Cutaneotrichosporon cavernicola]BEI86309.1 hypothetical protein CcaverHIS002_0605960 [Cutaneotrichosporon cavernicola]BEI94083.1 hypothetical protein CcaverHIS019_0605420 [Cutaneotrichosporon cavernicola]BEJ01862.1 hypothetical protein CcaverHIS631_0605440 [Cutaneotrichosporon cavernicola]BEJ09627.1 hypothetical protein CcaverHIS641_0605420 [Cutaneotrichosporon cavernicola]